MRTGRTYRARIAINESGVAAGYAATEEHKENFQFHAALWTDGKITDLKALAPDQCSLASAINAHGQAVGLSGDCNFDEPTLRAFLSENGEPVMDLNSLIPAERRVFSYISSVCLQLKCWGTLHGR